MSNANSTVKTRLIVNNDLVVDGTTLYVDSSNNRVGIGLINPQYTLDISGDTKLKSVIDRLGLKGNNGQVLTSTGTEIEWKDPSGGSGTNYWDLSGSNLYNNSGTNVGINTINPIYNVDISGETRIQTTNIRIGRNAGRTDQGLNSIAIGINAGDISQNGNAVAIGNSTGQYSQGSGAVAIGFVAGQNSQGSSAIAIGNSAGMDTQGNNAIAIGVSAGHTLQGSNGIGIGVQAGGIIQSSGAIAIGFTAGRNSQGIDSIAIGNLAGITQQSTSAVAIGYGAGAFYQSRYCVAIGYYAGTSAQSSGAIAIGYETGRDTQGLNAIAIGNLAGRTNQSANSIIINATGTDLSSMDVSGLFVAPVRNVANNKALYYNTSTSEITYNDICGGGSSAPAVFALNITNSTIPSFPVAGSFTVPINNLNANANQLANNGFTRTAADLITYSGSTTKTFSVNVYASIFGTVASYFALQILKNTTTAINQGYITTAANTNYEMCIASVVTLSNGDTLQFEGDNGGGFGQPRMVATASAPNFTNPAPTIPFQLVIREL